MEKGNKLLKNKINPITVLVFIILLVFSISVILPLLWGFLTSLKSAEEFHLFGNILGKPDPFCDDGLALHFGNYKLVLNYNGFGSKDYSYVSAIFGEVQDNPDVVFGFGDFISNSLIYALLGSFLKTFVALTCAYLCQKYDFKFSRIIYVVMLVVMVIPIVGSYPAMVKLLRDLAIYDRYIAMVLMNLNFTGVYFFVFHAFMTGVSNVYIEAAEIDGANQLDIYIRIIFPICAKIFGTVMLLQFIVFWNDYQTPLLYYPNHPTLSYYIYRLVYDTDGSDRGYDVTGVPQRITGCMMLAIPVLILFISTRKLLMGNLTMGGIKE